MIAAIMDVCPGRNSCSILPAESGERDALAGVRMMVSLLSIIGASAVISSILYRKMIWSSTIQPIFQICFADIMLSILWVIGSTLWFRGTSDRVGCFAVSVLTVILECVTANLTLVYAMMAYLTLKRKKNNITLDITLSSLRVWSPMKSKVAYITAWVIPVLIVGLLFVSLSASTRLVSDANKCSCWCFPHLGNVLPYSESKDKATTNYLRLIHKLQLGYSVILLIQFLFVLIIMAWLYWKTLQNIKAITAHAAALDDQILADSVIKGQALARKRILLFLTAFLGISLSIVVLAIIMICFEAETLHDFDSLEHKFFVIVHIFQSTTVPMQGFLNSIVYGWTSTGGHSLMGDSAEMAIRQNADDESVLLQTSDHTEKEDSLIESLSDSYLNY